MSAVPAREHIRALPKVELHTHVEGAAPPNTIAELARKHGVDLGVDDPADLYKYEGLEDFLRVYDIVCRSLRDAEDLHRVTYEALSIAADAGVRHSEMLFSPTFLMRHGVAFETLWEGIAAGIRDVEADHNIVCRMILDINKPSGPSAANELIDLAAACDRDVLIGIGGDAGETDIDLAAFAAPFDRARSLGFKTTMHLGEEGPAADIRVGVEALHLDRIDHGFSLIEDPALMATVAEMQVPVTSCPTSNLSIGLVERIEDHPVIAMRDAGVLVGLNSDNAAMFDIDLADEYEIVANAFSCSIEDLEDFSLAGVASSWLDPAEKQAMTTSFLAEMNELRNQRGLTARQ